MKKKLLSLLLALCMVLCLAPTTAFAENETEETPVCTCETACTEDTMNAECPVCGTEGALAENCGKYAEAPSEGEASRPETEDTPAPQEGEGAGSAANTFVDIEISDSLSEGESKDYTVDTKQTKSTQNANTKLTVHILKITKAGSYKLTKAEGATGLWCVEIAAGSGTVELTLSGMSLDVSTTGRNSEAGVPALAITGDCETVITLEGTNTLKGGVNCAGLQNGTHKLTITGEGSLKAVGGTRGAGIGGGMNANGGNITIENGTVIATGGNSAAGIGGGYDNNWVEGTDGKWTYQPDPEKGNGFNITITGGTVTATGQHYGAGIGGGGNGNASDITISGGTVTATGGATENIKAGGAGIGGGWGGSASDIEISGSSTQVTVEGKYGSADIGAGSGWADSEDKNGKSDYYPGTASGITVSKDANVSKGGDTEGVLTIGLSNKVPFLVIDTSGNETTHYSKEANLNSVITDGVTVKLLGDVTLDADESITISADKNFTLDLNGFTISQEKKQTKGHSLLTNNGTLTIKDSSAAGTGKITYEDTGRGGNYVSNTITNKGTLTVESGTIENTCSTNTSHNGFPYAIDNHSGNSAASLTITGGTVDCKAYSAIRLFCNSTANTNSATISGGTIRGCVEYQQPIGAHDKALGSLTITGGNFERNAANMKRSLYIFSYGSERDCSGMSCQITGGNFAGLVEVNGYAKDFNNTFITGGTYKNGQYKAQTFDNDPSNYVSENGTKHIVKRDGNADVNYVYTVLPKSNLTDGVYLSDPSDALEDGYYVSSTENGVWTVSQYTPPAEYTVTYTDGVDGEEIFKDQTYAVKAGEATPAFNGTPTRKGYTFAGWKPAVAATVTGNATYEATWKSNSTTTTPSDDKPNTGDNSNMLLWFALLFVSGGAAIGTMIVSRKKKYNG